MDLNKQKDRVEILKKSIQKRILVLDGAMGTAIQQRDLSAKDFGGEELEGCNENLVLTRPDVIQEIHDQYLAAGADIIETNTFGATPLVLAEYELQDKTEEINLAACKLARQAVDKYQSEEKPRFIAGSIGPTTKAITVTGGVTFEELIHHFKVQAAALYQGGVDYFLIETCQDTRNIKAALIACHEVLKDQAVQIPIAVSVTIEPMGTMLAGQAVEALNTSLEHEDLLYLGLNCATGPEFMTDHIRTLAEISTFPIACVPNAGLPDEEGRYLESPEMIGRVIQRFAKSGWLNFVGGCCGTTPAHIAELAKVVQNIAVHQPKKLERSTLSGIEFLEITDEKRPVMVGERTNVIGSRKFKRLIAEGSFEEASEIARTQVKNGAEIIDICLANPDQDEFADMQNFLPQVIQKIKVPLMIDSTDDAVVEMALTYSQGKAIINSINLEDGEERFEKVVPLAKKFGAALVVGTIDEDPVQGMGVTRQRKLEIAQRSYDLLTKKYGISPHDIYFDPLVFPVGTGDEQYKGSAVETIEGIRMIKEAFPAVKTVLGISNVSFGLPPAGREVLNSVYLHHCVMSGLDLALVNTENLERYPNIPDNEKQLCDDLLWNRGEDPIMAFTEYFREAKTRVKEKKSNLSLEERLRHYIIEGSKEGLVEDLEKAREKYPPLEIINGPLMSGMDEVGRLFNQNELIVAEVLQSAEAMKAAVAHLEQFMEKSDSAGRGKVVLATVKGDVHDIGKNLVDIILSNNGFEVINLGIKIPPEQLIAAIQKHQPDIVGLSGLLVKSAQQMVITADDLSKANIQTPILVGGAALSDKFTHKKIAPAYSGFVTYAKDAMNGLELAKQIRNASAFEKLKAQVEAKKSENAEESTKSSQKSLASEERSSQIDVLSSIPKAPDYARHLIKNTSIDEIFNYINPLMLLGRHLGVKGKWVKQLDSAEKRKQMMQDPEGKKSLEIWQNLEELKEQCRKEKLLQPQAVYQFFKVSSQGNEICIYENEDAQKITEHLKLPRQVKKDGLCLADYVQPLNASTNSPVIDNIAMFVVSVGTGIRELAEEWKQRGDYLRSHALQALALESAEAYAELLHAKLRSAWGFPDPVDITMMQRFQAKYRGKRYSFGYPACPDLTDQKMLFDLLKPQEIGVELTEGFMMEPEASVSALVFHHPQATYFSVGSGD
ncbi:MAG: methionine synthase [Deltaproteobacteria bacterium]|nr:methionine synthase [Deltaproteobacteria bacterium]